MNKVKKSMLTALVLIIGVPGIGIGSYYIGRQSTRESTSDSKNVVSIVENDISGSIKANNEDAQLSETDSPKLNPVLSVNGKKELAKTTIITEPNKQETVFEPFVYSQFQDVSTSNYLKNPIFYLNKKIKLTNISVLDFLGAGDRGGLDNYIQVGNNDGYFAIKIMNNVDYQSIVSRLSKSDPILVYGIGSISQSFSTIGGGKIIYPILTAIGITNCSYTSSSPCTDAMGLNIFGGDRGSWHTIISASDNNHGIMTNSFGLPGSKLRVVYSCNPNREDVPANINISIKPNDPGSASEIIVADNVSCPANQTQYFPSVDSPTRAYFLKANSVGSYSIKLDGFY